jgi:hypothetical protein
MVRTGFFFAKEIHVRLFSAFMHPIIFELLPLSSFV